MKKLFKWINSYDVPKTCSYCKQPVSRIVMYQKGIFSKEGITFLCQEHVRKLARTMNPEFC